MRYACLLLSACLLCAQIDLPLPYDPWILRMELETMKRQAEQSRMEQAKRNAALMVSQCEHNAIVEADKLLHARGLVLEKVPYGSMDAKFVERVRKAMDKYERCSRY